MTQQMKHPPTEPDVRMFVLDVIRHDFEQVTNICALLNSRSAVGWRQFWPRDFTERDVMEAISELLAHRLVEAFEEAVDRGELVPVEQPETDEASIRRYWFRPSPKGLELWKAWEAPLSEGSSG